MNKRALTPADTINWHQQEIDLGKFIATTHHMCKSYKLSLDNNSVRLRPVQMLLVSIMYSRLVSVWSEGAIRLCGTKAHGTKL